MAAFSGGLAGQLQDKESKEEPGAPACSRKDVAHVHGKEGGSLLFLRRANQLRVFRRPLKGYCKQFTACVTSNRQ